MTDCMARAKSIISWWRHQMETFSALLAICAGNSPAPVNSPHKGLWRGALMFPLFWTWISGWVSNRPAGYLRWNRAHYDVIVMYSICTRCCFIFVDYHKVFSRLILCSSINFMVASLEHRQSADTRPQQNTIKRDAWVSFVGYMRALSSEVGISGMDK